MSTKIKQASSLENYVTRKLRMARREWDSLSRCLDRYYPLRDYWEGQYDALSRIQKRLFR